MKKMTITLEQAIDLLNLKILEKIGGQAPSPDKRPKLKSWIRGFNAGTIAARKEFDAIQSDYNDLLVECGQDMAAINKVNKKRIAHLEEILPHKLEINYIPKSDLPLHSMSLLQEILIDEIWEANEHKQSDVSEAEAEAV